MQVSRNSGVHSDLMAEVSRRDREMHSALVGGVLSSMVSSLGSICLMISHSSSASSGGFVIFQDPF